jgi:hypothetical protein
LGFEKDFGLAGAFDGPQIFMMVMVGYDLILSVWRYVTGEDVMSH